MNGTLQSEIFFKNYFLQYNNYDITLVGSISTKENYQLIRNLR